MSKIEENLKRLTLAGIGAVAKGVERVDDFFDGKGNDTLDNLVKKGKEIVQDGKEANEELQHKVEQKFDEFCDSHRASKRKIDVESLTPEERADLLRRLQELESTPEETPTEE